MIAFNFPLVKQKLSCYCPYMVHKKPVAIPPSRKATPKRLTIWVTEQRANELKRDAKQSGMIFTSYLEKLMDRGWAQRDK